MGFSQSTFSASEDDGFVRICAELLADQLERDISLLVEVLDLGSNTGIHASTIQRYQYQICMCGGGTKLNISH